MKVSFVSALILVAVCTASAAQTKAAPAAASKAPSTVGPMKPGLWEITTINETAGTTTKRTVTARACYEAGDVSSVGRIVPQQREFGMKCETREAKQQGFDVTWRVACSGKDSSLSGTGKLGMGPEAYSGRADLEMKSAAGKPVKVEQKVSGKWIGPCK